MTFDDPRQERTPLRLRLYDNGYAPLPNHNKACFLPEWNSIKITPELIQSREWARSRAWADTGIRCGEVVAVDWDVNNEDLINDLLDAVIDKGVLDESMFVRIGKPPRELWVFRTSEKIGKRTTGGFVPEAERDNKDYRAEQVEILGAGCQFAAFGWRDDETQYQWPEQSLLDRPYMDLPVITLAQVEALKDFVIAFFEARGLVRKSPMAGTDGGYNHVYDLTMDMVFNVKDEGEMSVDEIGTLLSAQPDLVLRCSVETLRPGTSGSWAGMISLVNGSVCVSDHGTYTSHFPAEADDDNAMARLGALLAPRIERAALAAAQAERPAPLDLSDEHVYQNLDHAENFDTNLERALARYVFVSDTGLVYDLGRSFMTQDVRVFKNTLMPYFESKPGRGGGETITRLSEQWMQSKLRHEVDTAQMRPDMARPFFHEDGGKHLNTYRPVNHVSDYGSADIGNDMLERMLPIPAERLFLRQWLSHKLRNPGVAAQAIVLVAHETYGTGRGTLFKLLRRMFGRKYVSSVEFSTIAGRTSQSQYNEWRSDSILVTVNEAQDSDATSRWQSRNSAYEHLKEIVEPGEQTINVVRKGVRNSQARSFCSVCVATNHGDALVIPANDRRFAVLQNGDPQPQEYWERLHQWMEQAENVAAFVQDILATDMLGYSAYTPPPMTHAKANMIDSGASDLDRAISTVLASMPGRLLVKDQLFLAIEDYISTNDVDFPEEWRKTAEAVYRRKSLKVLGDDRVLIDGKQRVVRMLSGASPSMCATPEAIRAELDKNGPLTRALKTGGKVVDFRRP